ncbi:MAG: PmoA family protein [Phycisphaerae bacterium]|nr:PmoA family protein [Phycisphaerae bacterium]
MQIPLIAVLALLGGSTTDTAARAEDLALVVVHAGRHERSDTPVGVPVYPKLRFGGDLTSEDLARRRLELVEETAGAMTRAVPAQWQDRTRPPLDAFKTGALVFVLSGKTPAGTERRFRLRMSSGSSAPGPVRVTDEKGTSLTFGHGSRPVARYNYGLVRRHPDRSSVFDRSAYFHPVWAPCGEIVTDDFPDSHPHQRGLFLAWTRATIGDYKADFWNLMSNRGKTAHRGLSHVVSGPVFAGFIAENECVADGRVALKETWVTRVYGRPDGPWIMDFEIRHTATERPVVLEKYHYGGMAYRGRCDWLGARRPLIETSDGYDAKKGQADKARWVDMSGRLPNGSSGGVCLLDHPSNPTYPTPLRIHPNEPYYCFAFSQRGSRTIEPGKSIELRYRCVVHDGVPDRAEADRWARDFAEPPEVTVEPVTDSR